MSTSIPAYELKLPASMKKIFAGILYRKFIAALSACTWTIAIANSAGAAQLQEARVTQVVNDVKLLLEQAAPRPASISDFVRRGTAIRTGTQSRSELTFADLTITRLGANTIFSFKEGTREMNHRWRDSFSGTQGKRRRDDQNSWSHSRDYGHHWHCRISSRHK
jgi:hypothetical protein